MMKTAQGVRGLIRALIMQNMIPGTCCEYNDNEGNDWHWVVALALGDREDNRAISSLLVSFKMKAGMCGMGCKSTRKNRRKQTGIGHILRLLSKTVMQ